MLIIIETFTARMLNFVKTERRDYLPIFDVQVNDIADQSKMILTADIKFKSVRAYFFHVWLYADLLHYP